MRAFDSQCARAMCVYVGCTICASMYAYASHNGHGKLLTVHVLWMHKQQLFLNIKLLIHLCECDLRLQSINIIIPAMATAAEIHSDFSKRCAAFKIDYRRY